MTIQVNPFDNANLTALQEIVKYKVKAQKANPVPFGKERVTAKTAATRFQNMSGPERRAYVEKNGYPAFDETKEE